MEDIKKILTQRIRFLRELKGFTQEELAEKARLSSKFIGEIERGIGNPTIESLARIAEALKIPIAQLLTEEEGFELLSKQEIETIRKALQILEKIFGKK
jgi:transcriptional regulator with XRE-family HTH domain